MAKTQSVSVQATAKEVLPALGLAFVVDESGSMWGVTKSTSGTGLESLQAGSRVQLTLSRHAGYSLVQSYQRLD